MMRTTLAISLLLLASYIAYGQAVPSANMGTANFSYSVRYAETAEMGGRLGKWHTIIPSASLEYSSGGKEFPRRLEYTGGYAASVSGPAYATCAFQHLFVSQGMSPGRWILLISDDVGYRPQSPTTGFSGIPGIGEPIGVGTTRPPSQSFLTLNTHALDNIAHGEARRVLNHRSILNANVNYDLLHYPHAGGFDTSSVFTIAGIDFRLNERNSLITRYAVSHFGYSRYEFAIVTNSVQFGMERSWTRFLRMNLVAGPELINSSKQTLIPRSTGIAVQAGLEYEKRRTSMSIGYTRQTAAGSGYMLGAKSDDVMGNLSRPLNRAFSFEMNGGYRHSSELIRNWEISGAYGGIQGSWRVGRNMAAFVNYSAISQGSGTRGPANLLNEVMHTVSCGIAFTKEPKSRR